MTSTATTTKSPICHFSVTRRPIVDVHPSARFTFRAGAWPRLADRLVLPAAGRSPPCTEDVEESGLLERESTCPSGAVGGMPRSLIPMFGSSFISGCEYSGNASRNRFCWIFHEWLRSARMRFSWSLERAEPVVISSDNMKDKSPVRIVATDQAGFHVPG